jgi:hypothetical protein
MGRSYWAELGLRSVAERYAANLERVANGRMRSCTPVV